MNKAYLYIRWSSAAQRDGDSLNRQRTLAANCANARNLTIEELPIDDGVSAWKGKNLIEGSLGQFIKDVENGIIQTPTTLMLEQMDRAVRTDKWAGTDLLRKLQDLNVDVLFTKENKLIGKGDLTISEGIIRLIESDLAALESQKKSERVKAAWATKKKNAMEHGHAITNMIPFYLKRNGITFEIKPDEAAKVQQIFELFIDGYGTNAIAQYLNVNKVPTPIPARGNQAAIWYGETIRKLLINKAVIGYYNDKSDYYPAVISHELFAQVQKMRGAVKPARGGGNNKDNILAGMCRCAKCNDSMYRRLSNKTHEYRCRTGVNDKSKCNGSRWNADDINTIILKSVNEINVEELLTDSSATLVKSLRAEITKLEYSLSENTKIYDRLSKVLERTDDDDEISETMEKRKALRQESKDLEQQLNDCKKQLDDASTYSTVFKNAQDNISALAKHDTPANRLKINSELKKIISVIRLDNKQHHLYIVYRNNMVKHYFNNGEVMVTAPTDAKDADEYFDNFNDDDDVSFQQIGEQKRLISTNEVLELCGISRSSLLRYINKNTFPSPIKIGTHRVGFNQDEIRMWISGEWTMTIS